MGEEERFQSSESRLNTRLRELMDARAWTQIDVGILLHHSQSWISKRLNGTLHWRVQDLDALATLFGVTVPELFFDTYGQWDRRTGSDRRKPEDRRKRKQSVYQPVGHPPTQDRMGIESDDD